MNVMVKLLGNNVNFYHLYFIGIVLILIIVTTPKVTVEQSALLFRSLQCQVRTFVSQYALQVKERAF
jgi:hypothetical protein